jgi:hypothetical protein
MRSWPPASTAIVPVARLPRWAAASMPRARPETTAKPGASELAREPLGEAHARRRGVARADDGDGRWAKRLRVATHGEQRRSIVDHPQAVRSSLSASKVTPNAFAAAAGKIGQRRERGAGAAAVIDQGAEGPRPDIVAADEAQPVEALFVGQAGGFEHGTYLSRSTGP